MHGVYEMEGVRLYGHVYKQLYVYGYTIEPYARPL